MTISRYRCPHHACHLCDGGRYRQTRIGGILPQRAARRLLTFNYLPRLLHQPAAARHRQRNSGARQALSASAGDGTERMCARRSGRRRVDA
jgi:hypothetical protein